MLKQGKGSFEDTTRHFINNDIPVCIASITPEEGTSGGGLFNPSGHLVAVNWGGATKSYSVPVSYVEKLTMCYGSSCSPRAPSSRMPSSLNQRLIQVQPTAPPLIQRQPPLIQTQPAPVQPPALVQPTPPALVQGSPALIQGFAQPPVIKFTDDKGSDKAVYYMKYDLWNPNFEKRQELLKFVDSFGGHYLILKAASYLAQYPGYTIIHDYMLNSSSIVVQDDSGIPYESFNNGAWEINLWGNFETVLSLFHNYNQPDLKAAYDKLPQIKTLPFQIGYNVSIGESNLQYCIKTNPAIITNTMSKYRDNQVVKDTIKKKKIK